MDQVTQNLWIGGIASVADVENLKKNNIHSVLSAMRGRVVVQAVRVSRRGSDAQTLNPYRSCRPSPTIRSKSMMPRERTS